MKETMREAREKSKPPVTFTKDTFKDMDMKGLGFVGVRKTEIVWARVQPEEFQCETAHGPIIGEQGDLLMVSLTLDDVWPIKREIFDKTYATAYDFEERFKPPPPPPAPPAPSINMANREDLIKAVKIATSRQQTHADAAWAYQTLVDLGAALQRELDEEKANK
jgi:hypothetical protein